jgi:hypothetical protein
VPIDKADLLVALGQERQVDAQQGRKPLLHRTGREYEFARPQRLPPRLALDLHGRYAPTRQPNARHPRPQKLHPTRPRALQQHHAQLLGAEPAGAAGVQHRQRIGRKLRKVPPDQFLSVMMSAPVGAASKPGSGEGR